MQYASTEFGDTTTTIVQEAEADKMAARLNAALAEGTGEVASLTLAGAGDGHTFVVAMVKTTAPVESWPLGDVEEDQSLIGCYMASNAEQLAVARAAAIAAMIASTPPEGFEEPLVLLDEQIAGSSKGTRFMGMLVANWTESEEV